MLIIGTIVIGIVAVSECSQQMGRWPHCCSHWRSTLAIALGVLDQYQIDRLLTFTDPDRDLQGIGYNTAQARIAIGGGGLLGHGLFNGNQTQGAFVPYQQTDFVFSVAGEELGLIGASILIALVGVILWRGIQIAWLARDPFGRLVATGVVTWFAFQAFENIGMNLGIMPVTGVPLPLCRTAGHLCSPPGLGSGCFSPYIRSR